MGLGVGTPLGTDCSVTNSVDDGARVDRATGQLAHAGDVLREDLRPGRAHRPGGLHRPHRAPLTKSRVRHGVRSEWVELRPATARRCVRGPRGPTGRLPGGLLVFQEAFGVNAHIRDVTERFAAAGYLAISPELFHRTAPGFDCRYDDFPSAVPHLKAHHRTGTRNRRARGVRVAGRVKASETTPPRSGTAWADARRSWPNSAVPLKAAVVLLRREHPSAARPRAAALRTDDVCLGRPRSPHPRRTASGRRHGRGRGEQGVRGRGVLERRPRVLLRRARGLPAAGRRAGVAPDAGVPRHVHATCKVDVELQLPALLGSQLALSTFRRGAARPSRSPGTRSR